MKLNLLAISIGIPIGFFLIPSLGIPGVIVSALVAVMPGTLIGLYLAWKRYEVKVDFGASSRIVLASAIAALATYLLLSFLNVAYWLQLAIGFVLFLTVYLFSAPLAGAISPTDISNLRTMVSGLGIISKLLKIPLAIMERTLLIRAHRAEVQAQ
jgi:hypothetical protein